MNPFVAAGAAGFAFSPYVEAIRALYSITKSIDEFMDEHIDLMKKSENPSVVKVGTILGGAKYGFGVGYMTSTTIMAAGQLLLGNTLAAVKVAATAATLTNPISMTCAAVGAIYFGWNALSEKEKNKILENLTEGLQIGVEMIKSIIEYVIKLFKAAGDSRLYADLKKYVSNSAKLFGRTLSDITRKMTDKLSDASDIAYDVSKNIANKVGEAGKTMVDVVQDAGGVVVDVAKKGVEDVRRKVGGN